MKNIIRNIIIIISPFVIMILVNEIVRPTITEKPYSRYGVSAMNSSVQTPEKCTWSCHNNTTYCKQHHTKLMNKYFKYLDPLYFGLINLLASTGNYGLANIVFLIILWPLLMYVLLIKSLNMQQKIKKLKEE